MRRDPVELHHHDPDDVDALRDLVGDAEQPLHTQAVGGLVEKRCQVIHPGHEGDALGPVAVFEVFLDPGVQVADSAPDLGDGLALDLEDQPQHTVGGRVLGPHVDDDAFTGVRVAGGVDDLVPVLAADD